MEQGSAGVVESVRRYPVKSMQGEEVASSLLTPRGLLGDRAYAVVDRETGRVASAKHPRKWGRLIECRAELVDEPGPGSPLPAVRITLPDGGVVRGDEPEVHRVLSVVLGREVELRMEAPAHATREADRSPAESAGAGEVVREEPVALAAPAGTWFDVAVVHLLATGTLDRLKELHPAGDADARRFRPNVVIRTEERGFAEGEWLGREMSVGEARLRVIDPTPRCVVTTLAQGGVARDPEVLRVLARNSTGASLTLAPGVVFPGVAGVYADVLAAGMVRRGDGVRLL